MPPQDEPYAHQSLTSDGIDLALHAPRCCRRRHSCSVKRGWPRASSRLRQLGLVSEASLPRGLAPDGQRAARSARGHAVAVADGNALRTRQAWLAGLAARRQPRSARPPLRAEEGMWPLQQLPTTARAATVELTPEWLTRVRNASVRLANCSATFVSADGLLLTNQHCVRNCLAEHSSRRQNLISEGFLAPSREREPQCSTQVADVLLDMEDVTATITAATRNLDARAANVARKTGPHPPGAGLRAAGARRAIRRRRSAVRRSRSTRVGSTSSTATGVIPICAWCLHRSSPSPASAAIRIISSFRAGTWMSRCCGPMTPTAHRRTRPASCAWISRGRRPVSRCGWSAIRARPTAN